MGTVNEEFLDALIRHQIGLFRLSNGITKKVVTLLDATEADIAATIGRRLASSTGLNTPTDVRRMNTLLASIKATRLKAWNQVDKVWIEDLTALARAEPLFVQGLLNTVSPVILDTLLPTPERLRAIVTHKPFQGKNLRQWASSVRQADLTRIGDQVKIGMVAGEDSRAIARRVVGTVRLKGQDGVTQITRNQAPAVTRTMVSGVSNAARTEFFVANKNMFTEEVFIATLDNRTTPICQSLDGKRFPVGEGDIPPMHIQCRSLRTAVIDGKVIGTRPSKPVTEKMLVREFTKGKGFKATTRDGLPRGTKGAFDDFKRGRVRELTGQVPAKVTYQDWLTRQSAGFQDDVLGRTKGRLFRKGGLKVDNFVNDAGKQLNLSQLATLHRTAFVNAGLDPGDFI